MFTPISVLIIEDHSSDVELLVRLLRKAGYEVAYTRVETAEETRAALEAQKWDIIISDYKLPQFDGFAALKLVQDLGLDTPFILVSGTISQQTAIEIMTAGAQDYLDKNDMARLIPVLKREIKQAGIRRERKQADIALRNSEAQYRALIHQLPSGVMVHDGEKIALVNAASIKLFGAENPQQLTGTDVMKRIHPAYHDTVRARIAKCLATGTEAPLIEEKLLRLDQSAFDAEVAVIPIYYENKPSILAIFNDITERKQAEENLRKHLMELEAVHTVSKTLRSAQAIEEALPLLLDQTLAALAADTGVIWLHHPEQNDLYAAVVRGSFGNIAEVAIQPGAGIAWQVFETGKAHICQDLTTGLGGSSPDTTIQIPMGWGGVCAPILSDEQTTGVIFIAVRQPREITADEVRLLSSLTEITGAALYRMRSHAETVRRLNNLQSFHEIDRAIMSSFDLAIIFDMIASQILNLPKLDAAAALVFRPAQDILEYVSKRGFRNKSAGIKIPLTASPAHEAIKHRRNLEVRHLQTDRAGASAGSLWVGEEFQTYIGIPLIAKGELKGVLEAFSREHIVPNTEQIEFLNTLAGQAAIAIADTQLFDSLQIANQELVSAYDATIEGWSHALDLRDKETEGHTQRVTEMAVQLAKRMNIKEPDLLHFKRGAILHDIGKMGVPDQVLLKPDTLTDEERQTIEQHAQFAYEMLHTIKYLQRALEIPYCHHEKWDGSGYPRKLKGEQIPLAARIFAIVDVWDALTNDRPYRKAWSKTRARNHIRAESGKHFDPQVVEAFNAMLDEM